MGALLSAAALTRAVLSLHSGEDYADPIGIVEESLDLFRPSEEISTVDCAAKYRKVRSPEGALVDYDPEQTPYNIAKMDALDDPTVNRVVIVKPSRSGGTLAVQNYLFKMMLFGPMGDVGWYLGSDKAVKQHCERSIIPLIEDHERIRLKLGPRRSDNKEASKRIGGHLVEWLAANEGNLRDKEFLLMVQDEPDGWSKYSESPEEQADARQKRVGNRKKNAILSHPDKGWTAGVAPTWESSSRGIYIMRCVECGHFAAAHATKFWPDVPEFKLHYDKYVNDPVTGEPQPLKELPKDKRLEIAENTAGMACPHCGVVHGDKARFAMIDEAGREGWWMHRGQSLDVEKGIQGEPRSHTKRGFWDHGLMLKVSPAAELARGLEEALINYERKGGSRTATKKLREFHSKQLGEIFEGKAALSGVDAAKLRKRTRELAKRQDAEVSPFDYRLGEVPPGVLYLTAAVDVGGGKFDLLVRGWDTARRSWIIDRRTIRQREHEGGILRDIAPSKVQDDWNVLETELDRLYPLRDDPGQALPIACMTIDAGDGNVTWKAYEFARRMDRKCWRNFRRIRCIKGKASKTAPAMPPGPTKISKDSEGRPVKPVVTLHLLGVHELKEQVVEDVAVTDGSPGMVIFPVNFPQAAYEEIFNEALIDGAWFRNGDNETLDLLGYAEAARLMLEPDRKSIVWSDLSKRPVWAQPIPLTDDRDDEVEAQPSPHKARMERLGRMNRRITNR